MSRGEEKLRKLIEKADEAPEAVRDDAVDSLKVLDAMQIIDDTQIYLELLEGMEFPEDTEDLKDVLRSIADEVVQ